LEDAAEEWRSVAGLLKVDFAKGSAGEGPVDENAGASERLHEQENAPSAQH